MSHDTQRPAGCDEENCMPFFHVEHEPDKPYSHFCVGFRKGVIQGKETAIKNVPSDCFTNCILIGSHSESCGRMTSILNLPDFYLQFRQMFFALWKVGQLKRIMRSTLVSCNDEIEHEIEEAIWSRKWRKDHPIKIGTKFVEFFCSCGETFFREYNHENGKSWYKPNGRDKYLFQLHRDLGHIVQYRKCKRIKRGFWQTWGPYEYKK